MFTIGIAGLQVYRCTCLVKFDAYLLNEILYEYQFISEVKLENLGFWLNVPLCQRMWYFRKYKALGCEREGNYILAHTKLKVYRIMGFML